MLFVFLGQEMAMIFVPGSGSGRGLCFLGQEAGWVCVSGSGGG